MIMQMTRDGVVVATPRNCPRCGLEFRSVGPERVCPACRRHKIREPRPATRTLSLREKQIVALILQAKANKEIAWELHLTEGTIKEYLNRTYRKLALKNRTDLAIWALTSGGMIGDVAKRTSAEVACVDSVH
jgi:DNA-binding CsgD family transcriptional regulator